MRKAAIIRGYNAQTRRVKVEIPGLTDGAEDWPEAELEYPLGDDATDTEVRLTPLVWVDFINDDMRYPIVTGNRCKNKGNSADWRRWRHENMQLEAYHDMVLTVGNDLTADVQGEVSVNAEGDIFLDSASKVTIKVGGSTIEVVDGNVKITSLAVDVDATLTTINGQLVVNGASTFNNMATFNGQIVSTATGVGGGASFAGGVQIDGDITAGSNIAVTGDVQTTGDVIAGTVSAKNHVHWDQGDFNVVSPPVP